MKITEDDVRNIYSLATIAIENPVPLELVKQVAETKQFAAIQPYIQRCRLSNGWEVCFNYEFQRDDLIVRHVSILFPDSGAATVMAISRIMQIVQFELPLKELPSWTERLRVGGAICVHVVEPVNATIKELASRDTDRIKFAAEIGPGTAIRELAEINDV